MPMRLMNLRSVPDDEAEEIRALLKENGVDYYETPAGRWGLSSPAFWLRDAGQCNEAKSLLEKYHAERCQKARADYAELKRQGRHRRIIHVAMETPIRFVVYLALIAVVLYFSTVPFIRFGQ